MIFKLTNSLVARGLLALLGITLAMSVNAQPAVDASGQFNPAISGTAVVYSSVVIKSANASATANYDIALTLSDVPMTDYTFFATGTRFVKSNGYIDVRHGTAYVDKTSLANVVNTALDTKYRVWTVVDVPNKKYSTYVKTDDMPAPVLVFADAGFRKTTTTQLVYWSAVHNSQGDATPLTVHDVQLVAAMGDFPASYSDAALSNIQLSVGNLTPVFEANTTVYNVTLPKGTTSVNVAATPSFAGANVAGDGNIDVSTGSGKATITVTADNGTTTETYTVNFSVAGNYALSLPGEADGSLSNVAIPALNIASLPVTVEMWYKPDVSQNYYATLWYCRNATTNAGFQYDRWSGAPQGLSNLKGVWNGSAQVPPTQPIAGKWNHVAMVVTATSKKFYLNGVEFTETGTSFSNFPFNAITYLGWDKANVSPENRTLKGLIDEFRVWNTARTPQELEANKYKTLEGTESGLVGYWNFDDKAAVATDLTANGRHGTISGGTYVYSFDASDDDNDGIPAYLDNCPDTYNPDQKDTDGDGIGDVCDNDWDNDGVPNDVDNCPTTYNPDQTDIDEDGIGDICDPEIPAGLNFCMSLPGGSDGSLSHIDISGLNLKTLPYTVEMWVKPNGTQTDNAGLFYHRGTGNAGIQYASNWQGSGKLRFMTNIASNDYGTESGVVVTPNEWHHVAVVLTSSSSTMYLDGAVYSRNVTSPVYDFSTGKLYIGWDSGAANRAFKGLVDEVRVWNTARTAQEIADNKLQSVLPGTQGLVGYWNFDDRDFTKVSDATANALHGSYKGGTYALSTVFDPMVYKSSTLSQTSKQVNSPAYNAVVARLEISVENLKNPLSLTSLSLNLNGTTSLSDIGDINIYFTGKTATFGTATKIAGLGAAPADQQLTLACNQPLEAGTNYVWVTYHVANNAPKGNLLDVECTSFQLTGTGVNTYSPAVTAPQGALTINADIFIGNALVNTDVVTSAAYTTANGANFVSFQQNAIMTYKGYQYVSYWNSAKRVCIARKKLPNGAWQAIELSDYTSAHDLGDNHYNISFGICETDGTIHLAFDHHNDALGYRVSVPGLANNPELPWTATSFGAKRDYLVNGVSVKDNAGVSGSADLFDGGVTYPRFISKPDGGLLFECRTGWSGDGNSLLWEYNGSWTYVGEYMHGRYGTSGGYTSKCGYINGLHYTPGGTRLHASLVWRETPTASTNHEVYYAYSDDHGRTWYNNAGQLIANLAANNPLHYDDAGFKVYSVAENRGLINQESQAVDSKGKIHILQSYMLDSEPNNSNWADSRAKSYTRHIYQDANGVWKSDVIALSMTDRSEIAVDEGDNLYVVSPGYRVYFAAAKDNWQTWTEFDLSANGTATAEGLIDRESLLNESVLSFVFAHKSHSTTAGKVIVPYYLIDKSKPGTGTGLNVSAYGGSTFDVLLSQSLQHVDVNPTDISHAGQTVSLRCQGTLETGYAEAYTLHFTTSGDAKVWINDQLVLTTGTVTSATTFPVALSLQPSHKYAIKIEGQYPANNATAKLEWESARQTRELVPLTALYGTLVDIPNNVLMPGAGGLMVQYHPNPFALHTTVRVEGNFGYQLFDVQGAMLSKGEAVNQLVIGDSLEKGVYMLKITQGPRSKTLKLIKM